MSSPDGLAFLDPPYGKGLGEKALAGLATGSWLIPGAIAIFEEKAGATSAIPPEFSTLDFANLGRNRSALPALYTLGSRKTLANSEF